MLRVVARLSLVFACLVVVAAVAGCGGGSSSSESGNTKAAFIEEADTVCGEYQAEVAPIKGELETLENVAEPESPNNEKQIGELLNEALAAAEVELESIRELEVPAGDEATIEKLLGTAEEGNTVAAEGATALEEANTEGFSELVSEGEAINHRATKMAENYGLKVCGQSSA